MRETLLMWSETIGLTIVAVICIVCLYVAWTEYCIQKHKHTMMIMVGIFLVFVVVLFNLWQSLP